MNPDPTSLERLHDVIAPAPVPWWPPAPGWLWVLGLLGGVVMVAAVRGFLRWQHNRYRREALAEWERQQIRLTEPQHRANAVAALAELLKRTALSAYPREEVAALTGKQWQDFLDRSAENTNFSSGLGALLESAAYDPRTVTVVDEARIRDASNLVRHWLLHHRVGGEVA